MESKNVKEKNRKEKMNTNKSNFKTNKNMKKGGNKSNLKKKDNPNNYLNYINNKKEEEENDKKIKEIEAEIKRKREEKMKRFQLIENSRNKELFKLEIKVLRKLYGDLFIRIPNTFKQNNLTFENFVYEFGQEIHELFEFDKLNPSYDNLIKDVNILVIQKYPITPDLTKFNRNELKKYFYDLGINDDWSLIQKYKAEMDKIEDKERLMKIAQSMKDYYKELDDQIEQKKNYEKIEEEKKNEEKRKKMKEIEKMKMINQKKIEQLQKNEKLIEMLDKEKFEKISETEKLKQYYLKNLEEENKNMDETNVDLIKYKLDNAMAIQTRQMDDYNQKFAYQPKVLLNSGYNISDDQISSMVDQIMLKKREQNAFKFMDMDDLNRQNDDNNINGDNKDIGELPIGDVKNIRGINHKIEEKVNKILAKQKYKMKNK